MAVYFISIVDAKGARLKGTRALHIEDLDFAWKHFYHLAVQRMGGEAQIKSYECMKLSRYSVLYKKWEALQAKNRPPRNNTGQYGHR